MKVGDILTLPKDVQLALDLLSLNKFEAYIVGGCLRNTLMGKLPNDWDMTTSALPGETADIFAAQGYHVIETGLKHGTVTVIINNLPLEITTFRIDGEYSDSRHPDSVSFTRSLSEDLARRDFTVNAMAYNPSTGIVDLFGGMEDLEKKTLRAVGNAEKRFTEDALRILRAFRFSSEHGFCIETDTLVAAKNCRQGLLAISRERIYSELYRTLMGDFAANAMREIISAGILECIFKDYSEKLSPRYEILEHLPKKSSVRFACLFENFPSEAALVAINSLKMSNAEKIGIKQTLSALKYFETNHIKNAIEARQYLQKYGEHALDALDIANAKNENAKETINLLKVAEGENFPRNISQLCITGSDIIKLGSEGRMTGEILTFLLAEATINPELNKKETLISLTKKYILENKK